MGYSTKGELPQIIGEAPTGVNTMSSGYMGVGSVSGALYNANQQVYGYGAEASKQLNYQVKSCFDASRCSPAYYRTDDIVIPSSITMYWIIKAF